MWFKKADAKAPQAPEKLRYSKYYEHDGALRAYANRGMLLAFLCVPATLLALAFAVYVRIQPPTVIRIDANGEAAPLSGGVRPSAALISVAQGKDADPTDFEKRAFVRLFLERYLSFSAASVSNSWAESLNMMSANLRRVTLGALRTDNTVGKVQDEQMTSVFHLRSIEPSPDDPLSFTAFGVKEVHRVRDHKEELEKLVGEFHVRLVGERRSEQNPSGLLVAEYWEHEIEGERRDAILHDSALQGTQ